MRKSEFLNAFLPKKNQWYRYAIWLLKDSWEAEEAVQDLYMKLWDRRADLNSYEKVEAYALSILKNLCIDRIRKSKMQMVSLDQMAEVGNSEIDQLELSDTNELLVEIISQLPEQQRLILQLRNVEGFTIEKIAETLDLKKNTVEVSLSRARRKIRKQLEKMF